MTQAISASFAALAIVNSRHITVTYVGFLQTSTRVCPENMPAPVCVVQVYGADQQDANLDKAAIIISCILGAVMVLAFSFISLLVLFG